MKKLLNYKDHKKLKPPFKPMDKIKEKSASLHTPKSKDMCVGKGCVTRQKSA